MNLSDIKIGVDYNELREQIKKNSHLSISPLPIFTVNKYKQMTDSTSTETLYIKIEDGKVTDITTDYSKVIECGED